MKNEIETNTSHARKLDSEDPLAKFRENFYIPDGTIYVDGTTAQVDSSGMDSDE